MIIIIWLLMRIHVIYIHVCVRARVRVCVRVRVCRFTGCLKQIDHLIVKTFSETSTT